MHESHWIDDLLHLRDPEVETFQLQHISLLTYLPGLSCLGLVTLYLPISLASGTSKQMG